MGAALIAKKGAVGVVRALVGGTHSDGQANWAGHLDSAPSHQVGAGMGVVADAGPVGSAGTPRAKQDFEHNFDHMVDPEIFFEWLTSYDDRLKSQVATWLWLQHIESDFCSHSCDLCNCDLVNQVAAILGTPTPPWPA